CRTTSACATWKSQAIWSSGATCPCACSKKRAETSGLIQVTVRTSFVLESTALGSLPSAVALCRQIRESRGSIDSAERLIYKQINSCSRSRTAYPNYAKRPVNSLDSPLIFCVLCLHAGGIVPP